MISHEKRCIFVHIPKTGGTSIEDVIWPGERAEADLWMGFVRPMWNKYQTGGLQHLLASQIREEVGAETFDSYFRFAVVRNPWDKAVSQFLFMRKREDLRAFAGMRKRDNLAKYLSLIRKKEHVQWAPQMRFLLDGNGEQIVDHVARFERLEAECRAIFRRLDIGPAELPHRKKTERAPYQDYYNAETREMVADMYKDDIALLGYAF